MTPKKTKAAPEPFDDIESYIENTPFEARFDPLTIQSIVTKASPKHRAYGMTYDEYRKERARISELDRSEKTRMTIYIPKFFSNISADIARLHQSSVYPFVITMTELGFIHAQVDYVDEFEALVNARLDLFKSVDSIESESRYTQVQKQKIVLGSAAGARSGDCTKLHPNVPIWLHDAIVNTSESINISCSDLAFFAVLYGILNCMSHDNISDYIIERIDTVIKQFDLEIGNSVRAVTYLSKGD